MNIDELKRKEVQYTVVRGRAVQEHVDAVTAFGVEPDKVVASAYRELYEQLERKGLLQRLASGRVVREVVRQAPARGEAVLDGVPSQHERLKADILALIRSRPGENFYQPDFMERFATNQAAVSRVMLELVAEGLVRETQEGTRKRYWNPQHGDPNLAEFSSMNPSIAAR